VVSTRVVNRYTDDGRERECRDRERQEWKKARRVEDRGRKENTKIHTHTVSGMRAKALMSLADLLSRCLSSDSSGVPSTLKMMFS
jgi:hypothetical protein